MWYTRAPCGHINVLLVSGSEPFCPCVHDQGCLTTVFVLFKSDSAIHLNNCISANLSFSYLAYSFLYVIETDYKTEITHTSTINKHLTQKWCNLLPSHAAPISSLSKYLTGFTHLFNFPQTI